MIRLQINYANNNYEKIKTNICSGSIPGTGFQSLELMVNNDQKLSELFFHILFEGAVAKCKKFVQLAEKSGKCVECSVQERNYTNRKL